MTLGLSDCVGLLVYDLPGLQYYLAILTCAVHACPFSQYVVGPRTVLNRG